MSTGGEEATMLGRLTCFIGRHSWERRVNPEVGGPAGVHFLCRRCKKEKPGYDKPTPGQSAGFAGA